MFFVIVAADLEGSQKFYERLGYRFDPEQHGKGPAHFATALPSPTVLEIYPPLSSLPEGERFFIGVPVDGGTDTDALKQELIENYGGKALTPDIATTKSGIATLRDPTGILVRLMPT